MRIAHVLRRLSFDDWGGTEQVVWNIAKAQKAAGHEVRIFATTALCKEECSVVDQFGSSVVKQLDSEVVKQLGSEVVEETPPNHLTTQPPNHLTTQLPNHPTTEPPNYLTILRFKPIYPWWPMPKRLVDELDRKGGNPFVPGLGKALREWKPDVIHCHAMARIAELCLRTAQKLTTPNSQLSAKTVVSLHGGGANVPGEEAKSLMAPTRGRFPWGKAIDILMGWTRRVPEDFGGIVCVGEDEYMKYKEKHPHVMFLPNGVDCSLFATTQLPNRPTTQPPNHLTILCVARIDRQKNQMMLVEWLARNPGGTVRLVGPVTQPDYRAELEARAVQLGVSERVSFAGALKPASAELLREYASADVFVLPSRHEPFGIVVLEAWAAGLPVVASDVGGLGKLCAAHPDAAITFAPGNLDALDEALRRVGGDAALRERLSAAGHSAAVEYDWRTLAARLVDFYAEI